MTPVDGAQVDPFGMVNTGHNNPTELFRGSRNGK